MRRLARAAALPQTLSAHFLSPQVTTATLPPTYSATTNGLAPREKFDYWHDVVCRNLVDLDYRIVDDTPFDASFAGVRLESLNVSRIEASPHVATRNFAGISRADSGSLVFNFVLSGRMSAEQDGRSAVLGAGDGVVCDTERPYELRFDQPFKIACVQLPRTAFTHAIAGLDRVTALNFGQTAQLCPLVYSYLAGLMERAPTLVGTTGIKVSRNFGELLCAMLAEVVQLTPLPLSEYRGAALLRVKDFIERHLDDFELEPASVAAALKLSPRYINQLLEAEGTSLARYIWRRRLERAAADLRNPALRSRSISVIAMANGFNDLSHFSKAFRQRFEMSPREYRCGT
jgi:AraC family transcriptional activator of tynA and feaB